MKIRLAVNEWKIQRQSEKGEKDSKQVDTLADEDSEKLEHFARVEELY